jgi:hypothetical protein
MTKLASKYGISDVGLKKICTKYNIPTPRVGYWQKIRFGKSFPVVELPPQPEGGEDSIMIHTVSSTQIDANILRMINKESQPDNFIMVNDELFQPLSLIKKTKASLRKGKRDHRGIIRCYDQKCLDIIASENGLDRALRVMDAVGKALKDRGFCLLIDENNKTIVSILGETVEISLEEMVIRKQKPLTKSQEKQKASGDWLYPRPEYDYFPTGKLSLKIKNIFWRDKLRRTWSDGKKQKLEDLLNAFIVGLIRAAIGIKEKKLQLEKWEQERKEKERRRQELQQKKEAEERKLWALYSDSQCWQKSQ